MVRFFIFLAISGIALVFSACGYRTAPVPYEQPDEELPIVSRVSLKQQGNSWVFSWETPQGISTQPDDNSEKSINDSAENGEGADTTTDIQRKKKPFITMFRISVHKAAESCPACEPQPLGYFLIHLENGEISQRFSDIDDNLFQQMHFYSVKEHGFRFSLPASLLSDNGLVRDCFYTIEYTLDSGLLSVPSEQLYPVRLKPVPLPNIHVRTQVNDIGEEQKSRFDVFLIKHINRFLSQLSDPPGDYHQPGLIATDMLLLMPDRDHRSIEDPSLDFDRFNNSCRRPHLETFLLLEWDLQLETTSHVIQKDGKIRETPVYYGLNLYLESPEKNLPAEETQQLPLHRNPQTLINPSPLLYGSFSLLNFQGLLSARQVDRHGNESESITVFDGRY